MVNSIRRKGFTVIELLVVLAAVALLLSIATPRYLTQLDTAREKALRHNLLALRQAIDQFRADQGRGPERLEDLVQARYLREVPEDPITQRHDSWLLTLASERPGAATLPMGLDSGIADVRSGAPGESSQGTPYSSW